MLDEPAKAVVLARTTSPRDSFGPDLDAILDCEPPRERRVGASLVVCDRRYSRTVEEQRLMLIGIAEIVPVG